MSENSASTTIFVEDPGHVSASYDMPSPDDPWPLTVLIRQEYRTVASLHLSVAGAMALQDALQEELRRYERVAAVLAKEQGR